MKKNKLGILAKILLICIIGLIGIPNVEGNNLEDVVKELSAVGRLMNGIAMQNDFTARPENTKKVIAEFLEVPKAELLDELNTLSVDSPFKSLTAFHTAVKAIPTMKTKNISLIRKGMELLETMKNQNAILSLTTSDSPENSIKKSIGSFNSPEFRGTISSSYFDEVTENVKDILAKRWDAVGLNFFRTAFIKLHTSMVGVDKQWKEIKAYTTTFAEILKLKKLNELLTTTLKYAEFAKDYRGYLTTLTSLNAKASEVNSDLSSLQSIKNGNFDLRNLKTSLDSVHKYFKSVFIGENVGLTRALTIGFPKSSDEIGLLTNDLEQSKVLKDLSDKKSWKNVSHLMKQLMKFHVEMKKLEGSWRNVSQDPLLLSAFNEVINHTDVSYPHMQHLAGLSQVTTAMTVITGCSAQLAAPTETFDFDELRKIESLASLIEEKVAIFESEIKTMSKNATLITAFQKVEQIKNNISNIKEDTDLEVVKEKLLPIQQDPDIKKMIAALQYTKAKLEWLATSEVLGVVNNPMDWSIVTKVFTSLDGTGIKAVLTCLNASTYNAEGLLGLMTLRTNIDLMKEKDAEMSRVSKSLATFLKVKKELDATKQAVARTRRRREVPKTFKLEKYAQISLDVGLGLESLRSFNEILKAENQIQDVLSQPQSVHNAAEQSNQVWSESNRNKIKSMTSDLKALDKFAGNLKNSSLEKMWTVFAEADKLKEPEMEAKLLAKPIAESLTNSQDPSLQSAAPKFVTLSTLDLKFVTHHSVRVKSASASFNVIQDYFDKVFNITRHPAGDKITEKGINPITLTLIVGGAVSAVLLVVGSYFGYKHIRTTLIEKENWKNRERLWIYYGFINDAYNICLAAKNDMKKDLKQMIDDRVILDTYWGGGTALHHAVVCGHSEVVEMLVKAGANRALVNDNGQTAKELCRVKRTGDEAVVEAVDEEERAKIAEEDEKEFAKGTKCAAVFTKYAKRKFKPLAPKQKPWADFRCSFLFGDEKVAAQFSAKYSTQVPPPESDLMHTHCVVDVDKDGVFNIDQYRGDLEDTEDVSPMYIVFSPVVLVSTAWAKLVLEDPKNFTLDYEHRVTKVRYLGVVYETVDEWKRWIRGKMVSCCHNMYCYFNMPDDSVNKFNSIAYYLFSGCYNSARDAIAEVGRTDRPEPYWHKSKKRVILLKKEITEDIFNVEFADVKDQCEVMTTHQFWSWLLSMNGCKGLVMPVAGQPVIGPQSVVPAIAPTAAPAPATTTATAIPASTAAPPSTAVSAIDSAAPGKTPEKKSTKSKKSGKSVKSTKSKASIKSNKSSAAPAAASSKKEN